MSYRCNCGFSPMFSSKYDESLTDFFQKTFLPAIDDKTVIYPARHIVTMNHLQPNAEAIAVKGNKIYAVGTLDNIIHGLKASKVAYEINESFKDKTILPGFIEPHCHPSMLGLFWQWEYVGGHERLSPEGKTQGGIKSMSSLIAHLKKIAADPDKETVIAWGFDPMDMQDSDIPLTAEILDQVSRDKPVIVINASLHIAYINNKAINIVNFPDKEIPGLLRDNKNKIIGELREMEALMPMYDKFFNYDEEIITESLWRSARLAQRRGCTTMADLAVGMVPGAWQCMKKLAQNDAYPVRLSLYILQDMIEKLGGIDALNKAIQSNNDWLNIAGVKFITDGSIQGYTANMQYPYYYDRHKNGIKNITHETFSTQLEKFHRAGIQCAIHVNGDGAIQDAVLLLKSLQEKFPNPNIRHRLEHCQTVTDTQLRIIAQHNILINLFISHLFFWGDFRAAHTLGQDRVKFMNPAGSAKAYNIPFTFHSDAQVTPLDPLLSVWCAVKRQSASGKVYGEDECISVEDALEAITLSAAYFLNQETIKGSLEVGKLADFTILEDNPLTVDIDDIPNLKVHATMVDGKIFPV